MPTGNTFGFSSFAASIPPSGICPSFSYARGNLNPDIFRPSMPRGIHHPKRKHWKQDYRNSHHSCGIQSGEYYLSSSDLSSMGRPGLRQQWKGCSRSRSPSSSFQPEAGDRSCNARLLQSRASDEHPKYTARFPLQSDCSSYVPSRPSRIPVDVQ